MEEFIRGKKKEIKTIINEKKEVIEKNFNLVIGEQLSGQLKNIGDKINMLKNSPNIGNISDTIVDIETDILKISEILFKAKILDPIVTFQNIFWKSIKESIKKPKEISISFYTFFTFITEGFSP